MELKEALRYFFNHPKACLIAKTLLWLKAPQNKNRVGWASFQVKNGPEFLPDPDLTSVIEDEFVKANLSIVPVEVAYLLSQEDRRNLVNCLMDTSADKTLCPVGINYAKRKLAMCKSTNRDIEQIMPCDCEKTFLESFPIQKWISFLDTLTFQIEHTARKKLTRLENSIKYPFKPKILNHNARYQLPLCHVLFLCL